jgi:hypothetical protein
MEPAVVDDEDATAGDHAIGTREGMGICLWP